MFTGPGGDYHDRDILDCYIAQRNIASSCDFLSDESRYGHAELRRDLELALAELRRREATMEIKIADYIAANLQDRQLFYVFNHPTNEVMFHICAQFSELIDYQFSITDLTYLDNWLSAAAFPIHPAVHKALGLRFPYPGLYHTLGKRDVSMADALELFFDYYARNPEVVATYQAINSAL
jgi:hypothetical protein